MKIQLLLAAVALTVTLFSCSSGRKAYERGDYYEAVMKSVARLRQNPGHSKSRDALRSSYPLAVDWFDNQAKNEIASNTPFRWKNALQNYNRINEMYETIRQAPGAIQVIPNPVSYYDKIAEAKEHAADESYEAGITALMKGDRNSAKEAYFNFADVQNFSPGFKDVIEYLEKSKFEATLRIIVDQIPLPSRYRLSGDFFQDKVEEFLHTNYTELDFIRFYTPDEARTVDPSIVDHLLKIQFDDFSVGNTTVREREETITRDSVVVAETKSGDKTIPVYGTVKATYTTVRKEVVSKGLLSMVVVDATTNGVLTHRKLPGEYVWYTSWARFNGDERALSDEQLAQSKKRELPPPDPQDLFLEFTKPIYNQLVSAVKGFYNSY